MEFFCEERTKNRSAYRVLRKRIKGKWINGKTTITDRSY